MPATGGNYCFRHLVDGCFGVRLRIMAMRMRFGLVRMGLTFPLPATRVQSTTFFIMELPS